MQELVFGDGKMLVAGVSDNEGRRGIVLRHVDRARGIDEPEPGWVDGETFDTEDGDVVIWFKSLAGARILQDRVNILCLQLNEFDVRDKKS